MFKTTVECVLVALLLISMFGCHPVNVVCPKKATPRPAPSPKVSMIVFTAAWCPACQRAKPFVKQLEAAGTFVRRVDIDAEPEIAKQYNVTSVPTFILYPNTLHEVITQDIQVVLRELKNVNP